MTRAFPEALEFATGEYGPLLERMAALAATGKGWVNIRPVIAREDEPEPPGPLSIFGGAAHKVPTITWMPGKHGADGVARPTTVGLQQSSGPRVVARLRDLGLPMPDGWKVTQDHPRRGLVAKVPAGDPDEPALAWLIRAATVVCAVPTTGRWAASVHPGS